MAKRAVLLADALPLCCPDGWDTLLLLLTVAACLVAHLLRNSRRNSLWANSALVVTVQPHDWQHLVQEHGPLAGLALQVGWVLRVCGEGGVQERVQGGMHQGGGWAKGHRQRGGRGLGLGTGAGVGKLRCTLKEYYRQEHETTSVA